MSTEQSYVGRGNNAPISPQTGENAPPAPSTVDNRTGTPPAIDNLPSLSNEPIGSTSGAEYRKARLLRLVNNRGTAEYLEHILTTVGDFMGTTDPVPAINDLLASWLSQPWVALTDEENKLRVRSILKLTTFLVELRSMLTCFELELENVLTAEPEEGAGHE